MTAAFFLGAWLFFTSRNVLNDHVTFDQTVLMPFNTEGVDEIAVAGTDDSQGMAALAFETSTPLDGGSFFVILYGEVYCQVLVVQHVHGDRVRGITKFLTPDCASPLIDRTWKFRGHRV